MFGALEECSAEAAPGTDRPGSGSCSSVRFVHLHFLIFREEWNWIEKQSMPFEVVKETESFASVFEH